MRGKTRADDVDHRILVLNWIKRRGMLRDEIEEEKKKKRADANTLGFEI